MHRICIEQKGKKDRQNLMDGRTDIHKVNIYAQKYKQKDVLNKRPFIKKKRKQNIKKLKVC